MFLLQLLVLADQSICPILQLVACRLRFVELLLQAGNLTAEKANSSVDYE